MQSVLTWIAAHKAELATVATAAVAAALHYQAPNSPAAWTLTTVAAMLATVAVGKATRPA